MRVFVKNLRGEPLMPCSTRKARLLLKQGKAKIIRVTRLKMGTSFGKYVKYCL
ncbi:RRXRR domain-containing protein [Bacillus sp. DX1.1]|uniref:RRXRR domain-containing protein n=1 Tax=unclassified Bacillus (in: firmicutes) TaxID=185979 RepID=UPI00256FD20A|nr:MULTISPECIES: RRXRR domain-containing protein [unclassified Bacillus (in: firmicutes)]MDM5153951.1 RRXRR domain-containing protein [Bacillus sp. DX1.1]WJE82883.1 RRXRR domain-containing protein [Bacillus sp. DX3.1]